MAGPNITKLPTLPWPVLAGASALLHTGVLVVGLPHILPVDNPGDNSANIPITLVGDKVAPVAAPANLPQTTSPPQRSAPQPLPIDEGQNTAAEPTQPLATAPQTSPAQRSNDATAEQVEQPQPSHDNGYETPSKTSENQLPLEGQEGQSGIDEGTQAGEGIGDDSQQSNGPTEVIVLGDQPLPQGFVDIAEPPQLVEVQNPLSIPSNHSCSQGSVSNLVTLSVVVDEQGRVFSQSLYADYSGLPESVFIEERNEDGEVVSSGIVELDPIDNESPNVIRADCLLGAALLANPRSILFKSAKRSNNIGGLEDATTNWQLRLQFR